MALFVGILLALGAAYFFGLMTGLAGRDAERVAATTPVATSRPTPERIASLATTPTPIRPRATASSSIPAFPKPVLGKEPTGKPALTFFEDGSDRERTAVPGSTAPRRTPTRIPTAKSGAASSPGSAASEEFWVQVTSVTSEKEARLRRDRLVHRGYRARVLVGEGPKGKIYRVRVGPYGSREEASRASDRLSREEKVKTWIAPPGK